MRQFLPPHGLSSLSAPRPDSYGIPGALPPAPSCLGLIPSSSFRQPLVLVIFVSVMPPTFFGRNVKRCRVWLGTKSVSKIRKVTGIPGHNLYEANLLDDQLYKLNVSPPGCLASGLAQARHRRAPSPIKSGRAGRALAEKVDKAARAVACPPQCRAVTLSSATFPLCSTSPPSSQPSLPTPAS